jgi:hypothetical protein
MLDVPLKLSQYVGRDRAGAVPAFGVEVALALAGDVGYAGGAGLIYFDLKKGPP